MKLAVGVGAALLVLGGVLFFVLGSSAPEASVLGTQDRTPTTATALQKTLLVKAASTTASSEITSSQDVYVGDILETLHSGRGLLQSANGTQTLLDYDTQVTIKAQDPAGTHQGFFLALGSVWARVEKVFGQGEFYEIETQNAVAAVRGTSFSLAYKNKLTKLVVVQGVVGFIPVDPVTGKRLVEKEVRVAAGKTATLDDAGNLIVLPTAEADKKTSWYLSNTSAVRPAAAPTPPQQPINTTPANPTSQTPPTPTAPPPQPPAGTPLTLTSLVEDKVVIPGLVHARGSGFKTLIAVIVGKMSIPPGDINITGDTTFNFATRSLVPGTYYISVVDVAQHSVTFPSPLVLVDASAPPQPPGTAPPNQPPNQPPYQPPYQ